MREIKFRAWSEYSNQMIDWVAMMNEPTTCSVLNGDDEKIHVMQYTGLKDKNGREIYEGDVYSYELYKVFVSGGHVEETTEKSVDVVEFIDGAFCHGEELLADVLEWDESVKYEGNIFENPELLEV